MNRIKNEALAILFLLSSFVFMYISDQINPIHELYDEYYAELASVCLFVSFVLFILGFIRLLKKAEFSIKFILLVMMHFAFIMFTGFLSYGLAVVWFSRYF